MADITDILTLIQLSTRNCCLIILVLKKILIMWDRDEASCIMSVCSLVNGSISSQHWVYSSCKPLIGGRLLLHHIPSSNGKVPLRKSTQCKLLLESTWSHWPCALNPESTTCSKADFSDKWQYIIPRKHTWTRRYHSLLNLLRVDWLHSAWILKSRDSSCRPLLL